ncbi:hypothetical protein FVER53590_26184 [Fusarium verticillioides]|nr:hypothetical protein FVER53590_26184 [Fusarium verticillioides]
MINRHFIETKKKHLFVYYPNCTKKFNHFCLTPAVLGSSTLRIHHARFFDAPTTQNFVAAQNRKSDNEILSPADLSPPASTEPALKSGLQDFPPTLSVRPYTSLANKRGKPTSA